MPRAVTAFMVDQIDPCPGEILLVFATVRKRGDNIDGL